MRAEHQTDPAKAVGSSHDRILAAAKQLFASRGYENTSTVAIARMAGTSESQLMKHFGSKEGLLEAIFEQGWERLGFALRRVHDLETPTEKLLAMLDLVLTALDRDEELKELVLLEGRRVRKEGRMILLTRGYQDFVKMLDSLLLEMRAAGEVRPAVNLEAARSGIMGMMEGLLRDQLLARRVGYAANYTTTDVRSLFADILQALR
jgi:AcrR family transcriptional regulator